MNGQIKHDRDETRKEDDDDDDDDDEMIDMMKEEFREGQGRRASIG